MTDLLLAIGLKYAGGTQALYRKRVDRLGIDTSHFVHRGRQGIIDRAQMIRRTADEILVDHTGSTYRGKVYQLRRALLEVGVEHRCNICGQAPTWMDKPLTLEIDHLNGNNRDDRRENLQFLCPNCHTQTETYARQSRRSPEVVMSLS